MASEAQILANQLNSRTHSCGPKTPEGKERSRMNALKHGLTGAGVVLPLAENAEVGRRMIAFQAELNPSSEVEEALVRHMALCSVRMDRAAMIEAEALARRVCQAAADFVAPEGVDAATAARMREDACTRAIFDHSKEATLVRKYESAAERGFFRAIKELRQFQKQSKARDPKVEAEALRQELGSFLADNEKNNELYAEYAKYLSEDPFPADLMPRRSAPTPQSTRFTTPGDAFDVPFAVGKAR